MGTSELPVVSTSHLLHIIEKAAVGAIAEHLDSGETSYLTSSSIELSGTAQVGDELRATARCALINPIGISARELTFDCDVYSEERHIAHAVIKRATVERVSFLARTAAEELLAEG
jgi:predicted thioesterase